MKEGEKRRAINNKQNMLLLIHQRILHTDDSNNLLVYKHMIQYSINSKLGYPDSLYTHLKINFSMMYTN